MSFILGMDTGGTYTDGVIIKAGKNEIVCKAKALTTKEDLTVGIKECLDNLDFDRISEVSLVSLSTTLATNAIVEGRGGTVGLIYMGKDLEEEVPAEVSVKVKGRCDIMGHIMEELDEEEAKAAIKSLKGKVNGVAISGYASVRNPKQEKQLAIWVREILDLPIVCAHQLTSALGLHQRTVTAVLNARLIPIIDDLMRSTKKVLQEKGISAPIMIVKGDGTLMTEAMAKERPIETILSGPAASVIGGSFLTGSKEAIVLDMGGTTTDVANVEEGVVKIKKEGARVGGWLTRVQAAEISTFGLGGDSRIYLNAKGRLMVGPHKVIPLCLAGQEYPALIHELKSFRRLGEFKSYSEHEADCFLYIKGDGETADEKKVVAMLKEAPHSITYLAKAIGEDPERVDLNSLVEKGIVARISFTPTDVLHAQGRYSRWNMALSRAGAEILAKRMEIPTHKFLREVEEMIVSDLAMTCLQSIADFEGEDFRLDESPAAMYLIDRAFRGGQGKLLLPKMTVGKPVVAIGAPAKAWVLKMSPLVNTEVIVPEHADVANAIGAAVGQITQSVDILVSVDGNSFILNTGWSREVYKTKEEALFFAVHEGRKFIEHSLRDAGCSRWNIVEKSENIMVELEEGQPKVYMGTKMKITGVGVAL